jgi:hypothetical protein
MRTNLNTVISLAHKVRKDIEALAKYKKKHPYRLDSMCAIASYHLLQKCKKVGVFPTFTTGHFSIYEEDSLEAQCHCNHCWIEFYGKIIDITATQFSEPGLRFDDVYITNTKDKMYNAIFYNKDAFDNLRLWPEEQSPVCENSYLRDLDAAKLLCA